MSSKFVSGGTIDQPLDHDDEWLQAQKDIEARQRRKEEEESRQEGGKTLYEVLQQNKGDYLSICLIFAPQKQKKHPITPHMPCPTPHAHG